MYTKSYDHTIEFLGNIAPSLSDATQFIRWAEEMTDLVEFIYSADYDQITQDIVDAAKEAQDWEDSDDQGKDD